MIIIPLWPSMTKFPHVIPSVLLAPFREYMWSLLMSLLEYEFRKKIDEYHAIVMSCLGWRECKYGYFEVYYYQASWDLGNRVSQVRRKEIS